MIWIKLAVMLDRSLSGSRVMEMRMKKDNQTCCPAMHVHVHVCEKHAFFVVARSRHGRSGEKGQGPPSHTKVNDLHLICAVNLVSLRAPVQQVSSEMSPNQKLASQKSHEAGQRGLA